MPGSDVALEGRPGIDRPIRVLHCPTDVGGNPQNLARMERELGADSTSLVFQPSKFRYESDRVLFDNDDGVLHRQIKVWNLIFWTIRAFDVIHYNFGRPLIMYMPRKRDLWPPRRAVRSLLARTYLPLFEFADVALLKRFGKAIAVTYQGSDARQIDYCLANYEITHATEKEQDRYDAARDARKRIQIARFRRYADRVYALNPDLLNVLPGAEFLPYAHVDMRQWMPVYPEPKPRPRILHAPTNRRTKGTRFLLAAADRLQNEGVPFDLELVENLSYVEAQQHYVEADLVVDQLLAGWYGGFAVEAMALGKPVIAYLRESDLHVLPREMRQAIPVIHATPETIYSVLKEWLTIRRHELPERGRSGRAYVERWHDPRATTKRLIADYQTMLRDQKPRHTEIRT